MKARRYFYWCIPLALLLFGGSMAASGCELIVHNDLSLVDGGDTDGGCPICLVDGMVITDEAGDPEIVPKDSDASADADAAGADAAVADGATASEGSLDGAH